jgi:tryptophan-rich sensory protein
MNSLVSWKIAPYVYCMDVFVFVILLVTCFAAGATGALFQPGRWYQALNKPVWTPPNWAFPLAWTTIYFSVSFAGARVADMEGNAIALAFWAMQAGFSTLWTPVFFGLRRLRGALLVMLPLWVSVLGATLAMFELDRAAGLAFLPYILWVTIAAALNYRVAQLNPTVAPRDLSAD